MPLGELEDGLGGVDVIEGVNKLKARGRVCKSVVGKKKEPTVHVEPRLASVKTNDLSLVAVSNKRVYINVFGDEDVCIQPKNHIACDVEPVTNSAHLGPEPTELEPELVLWRDVRRHVDPFSLTEELAIVGVVIKEFDRDVRSRRQVLGDSSVNV